MIKKQLKGKRFISYLLLCIVLLPLMLSVGLQTFQQYIKHTVSERLSTESLVTISIPLQQVQWMEEGREIKVHGKMFDIKRYKESDGYLVAEGVYDEEETAVLDLLGHFGDKEQGILLIQLLALAQTFVASVILYMLLSAGLTPLKHILFYLVTKPISFLSPPYQPPRPAIL